MINQNNNALYFKIVLLSTILAIFITITANGDMANKNIAKNNENLVDLMEEFYGDNEDINIYINDFINNQIPNFQLKKINGEEINLFDLITKNTIIEIMGVWCPACKKENKEINDFLRTNSKINYITIALDSSADEIIEYKKEFNSNHSYYIPVNNDIISSLELKFIPIKYFINKDKQIKSILIGASRKDEIQMFADLTF